MPVSAQNILYRDYANKHDLHFMISVNELFFPGCFLNLWGLVDEIDQLEGVLMCSIFMLPPNADARKLIYQRLLDDRGVKLVADSDDLAAHVSSLFSDDTERQAIGQRALAVVNKNRGALDKVVDGIIERV